MTASVTKLKIEHFPHPTEEQTSLFVCTDQVETKKILPHTFLWITLISIRSEDLLFKRKLLLFCLGQLSESSHVTPALLHMDNVWIVFHNKGHNYSWHFRGYCWQRPSCWKAASFAGSNGNTNVRQQRTRATWLHYIEYIYIYRCI